MGGPMRGRGPDEAGPDETGPDETGADEAVTDQALDVAAFRAALGCFATGITVVTTTLRGEDHAMTANAFTSVSLDPPIVLVCVEKIARFHEAVLSTGNLPMSILEKHVDHFIEQERAR